LLISLPASIELPVESAGIGKASTVTVGVLTASPAGFAASTVGCAAL
jgi:hypothetical protein